jgi:hypothetical protein
MLAASLGYFDVRCRRIAAKPWRQSCPDHRVPFPSKEGDYNRVIIRYFSGWRFLATRLRAFRDDIAREPDVSLMRKKPMQIRNRNTEDETNR